MSDTDTQRPDEQFSAEDKQLGEDIMRVWGCMESTAEHMAFARINDHIDALEAEVKRLQGQIQVVTDKASRELKRGGGFLGAAWVKTMLNEQEQS